MMSSEGSSAALHANVWNWLLLFAQAACSVLAGVYTEALLKGAPDPRVTTNLSNSLMYMASIVCNVGYMVVDGTFAEATSLENLSAVATPSVLSCLAIMS